MILTRVEKDRSIDCLYDSSNILASSYNKENNDLTVTFKRGTQYIYRNVAQRDYVRFETAESQGQVLNTHIKSYPFIKGDDVNVDSLINEINSNKTDEKKVMNEVLIKTMKDFITKVEASGEIDDSSLSKLNELISKNLSNEKQ